MKKKEKRTIIEGRINIKTTFNNTIVTVTDMAGNAISWASSGHMGFKSAKKSTPFAARVVTETACKKALDTGLKDVHVLLKGPGIGRDSAVRSVAGVGLNIKSLKDVTPLPHNGCRPRKTRKP